MLPEVPDLIAVARQVQGVFSLTNDLTAGSVGAALRTRSGRTVTGICMDVTLRTRNLHGTNARQSSRC